MSEERAVYAANGDGLKAAQKHAIVGLSPTQKAYFSQLERHLTGALIAVQKLQGKEPALPARQERRGE
jgi:hypothetical protein